tara:strand:- start:4433 stop:5590 length:1158 start_codon:yes stop_codon:yes gene_type:complete
MEDNTISENKDRIKPFYAIKIFEKGKAFDPENKKTIHLSLGEPSANLPNNLLKEVGKRVLEWKIGYTESIGLLDLRKAIVNHYKKRYKVEIKADQVAITSGASASILLSLMSLFNPGDTVAVVSPGYPCYINILKSLRLKVFNIQTTLNNQFQLDIDQIINLPSNIKGIILASPSNPTGVIIHKEFLKEINKICIKKNIIIISDEIYQGINYNYTAKEETLLSINPNGIIINSFSKYFLMTGWRLGWIISNRNHINKIAKIAMNIYLSPSSISQYAALETFKYYKYFDNIVEEYNTNRDFLAKKLIEMGFSKFYKPDGAFYFYIDVSDITQDSYNFCMEMVKDINITVAPGIDFDNKNGKSFIRISFAGKKDEIFTAMNKIQKWI